MSIALRKQLAVTGRRGRDALQHSDMKIDHVETTRPTEKPVPYACQFQVRASSQLDPGMRDNAQFGGNGFCYVKFKAFYFDVRRSLREAPLLP